MTKKGKARIIEAARRAISKNGINGATVRGIAEEANISTGAIYHYYSNKEEILYDVMDESLSVSAQIAKELQDGKVHNTEIINEICDNIVKRFEKVDENRLQFQLVQEAILGNEELKKKFNSKYGHWINDTKEIMVKLYDMEDTPLNTAVAALLMAAIDGVVVQSLLGANRVSIEDIAKVYRLVLLKGIPRFLEDLSEA